MARKRKAGSKLRKEQRPAKAPATGGAAAAEGPAQQEQREKPPQQQECETSTRPEEWGRPVRLYADGIFDLFHFGHARALEQAKKAFPNTYLLVGCCNDALTHKYKGRTVLTEEERYESLRHCKWVDEVIPDAPWIVTNDFLDKHAIDFVAHDDLPYADTSGGKDDVYAFVKKAGRFKATQRTEGVSTSDIILRILKDYNSYVLRNLKRGYTRKDLGISLVKEQRIRAGHNIKNLSQRLKEQRLRMTDRIQKRIGANVNKDTGSRRNEIAQIIQRNGEEFAQNVEVVVDKMIRGDYGKEFTDAAEQVGVHMDKFVSGFIRSFEKRYFMLEQAVKSSCDWRRHGSRKRLKTGDCDGDTNSPSTSGSDSPPINVDLATAAAKESTKPSIQESFAAQY